MYWVKAEHCSADHSVQLVCQFVDLSGKRIFRDVTFPVCCLFIGFPGVLPSTTHLLDAI